ncbi:hypothetical protein [Methylobacterium sp. J-067]|uniref:hypothetical protein n=1 Tax=Methylobacterium sp. J-067 TaxID=2836648 RepID=UPI001FBB9DB4|nr:hypothetical protein [Methylobacterium sp. J-067]MCJ2025178.1 hypothetical protein [Methylobacterium sp. J-067]
MPLKVLIGPIAAATIVTVFWFTAMWRGHQNERRRGKPTWQYELGLIGYISALGLFVYLRSDLRAASGLDIFGIALAGQGLGIVVVFALVQTFVLSSGQTWKQRAFPIFGTLLLVFMVVATTLAA